MREWIIKEDSTLACKLLLRPRLTRYILLSPCGIRCDLGFPEVPAAFPGPNGRTHRLGGGGGGIPCN